MRDLLIVSIPILLAIGCAPSAEALRAAGTWSAAARNACRTPGCREPRACIQAVVDATKPTSGRKEYSAAETACWPYRETP